MSIIAFITEPSTVRQILNPLGEPTRPPSALANRPNLLRSMPIDDSSNSTPSVNCAQRTSRFSV